MSSMWSSRSGHAKSQQYELPRWHQPSMAASVIPPPIVTLPNKSSLSAASAFPQSSVIVQKPQAAETRESELQADLQFLLDAQAEGLLRGVDADEQSSTGSPTPTTRSALSDVPQQVNRPIRRRIGLRRARKGIYSCIVALAAIKDEELEAADTALRATKHDLKQIRAWQTKKQGLEDAAAKFDDTEESVRVQRLRQEADVTQEEILKVETQLSELRAKHRQLLRQAAAVENAVQAKLATYTSSLTMLEADVKQFLSLRGGDRPVQQPSDNAGQSVWQLPPQRRTLESAREQIKIEQQHLSGQADAIRLDKDALDDGAVVWKDVAGKVTEFEKQLRAEMTHTHPSMTDSTQAWDEASRDERTTRMKELFSHLTLLIDDVEKHLRTAEANGWTLLIAAIGAELDALQRGKAILAGVVGPIEPANRGDKQLVDTNDATDESGRRSKDDQRTEDRHDTDEEPDPELLFSVQDGNDD